MSSSKLSLLLIIMYLSGFLITSEVIPRLSILDPEAMMSDEDSLDSNQEDSFTVESSSALCQLIQDSSLSSSQTLTEWSCDTHPSNQSICSWSGVTCKSSSPALHIYYALMPLHLRYDASFDLFYTLSRASIDSEEEETLMEGDDITNEPSIESSAETSAEESSETSIEPSSSEQTLYPSPRPTSISAAPSTRPSTKGDTLRPTSSSRPTRLPSAASSLRPSKVGDTIQPTAAPTPPKVLTFVMSQSLTGISKTEFYGAVAEVYLGTVASFLGIQRNQLNISSITDVATKHHFDLTANGIAIDTTITVASNSSMRSSTDVVDAMTNGGTFGDTFKDNLLANLPDGPLKNKVSSIGVSNPSVLQLTDSPSMAPSSIKSSAATKKDDESTLIIIIVCVIVGVLCLVTAAFYFLRRSSRTVAMA